MARLASSEHGHRSSLAVPRRSAREKPRAASGAVYDSSSTRSDYRRLVRFPDRKLVELATKTADSVDWNDLVHQSESSSREDSAVTDTTRRKLDEPSSFSVAVARMKKTVSVTSSGSVSCTVAELRALMRPETNDNYAAMMRELFGPDFIYGAIVHRVDSCADSVSIGGSIVATPRASRRWKQGDAAVVEATPESLEVRTAAFVKRHVLARSEQWCFVNGHHAATVNTDDGSKSGFAVSMTSLHPDDVFSGKTHADASALTGITAAFVVVPGPTASTGVRVTFSAQVQRSGSLTVPRQTLSLENLPLQRGLSERAVFRRLKEIACVTRRLQPIIWQRRINAQVLIDPRLVQPGNTRCACCTRRLGLPALGGRRKKQCHLCGFFVCEPCSSLHELKRTRVRHFVVRICGHCVEWIEDGDFDNVASGRASPPSIAPNPPGAESSNRVLKRLLRQEFEQAPTSKKQAVKTVIRSLTEQDKPKSLSFSPSPQQRSLTDASPDNDYLEALVQFGENGGHSLKDPSLRDCMLASSRSRSYSLGYRQGGSAISERVPVVPAPADELARLKWLEEADLAAIMDHPELEVLCDLARKELKCQLGVVTLVSEKEMQIVAASEPSCRGLSFPREQSFCTHTIMNALPVLVPHPEADVRYCRQNAVRGPFGTRFYFGFPLKAADDTVIGTFCCSDNESHSVTQSQYVTMAQLAQLAASVVQRYASSPAGSVRQ